MIALSWLLKIYFNPIHCIVEGEMFWKSIHGNSRSLMSLWQSIIDLKMHSVYSRQLTRLVWELYGTKRILDVRSTWKCCLIKPLNCGHHKSSARTDNQYESTKTNFSRLQINKRKYTFFYPTDCWSKFPTNCWRLEKVCAQ